MQNARRFLVDGLAPFGGGSFGLVRRGKADHARHVERVASQGHEINTSRDDGAVRAG